MTHYVDVNGKQVPFPDDWSDEQISSTLSSMSNGSDKIENNEKLNELKNIIGTERTPFSNVRDFAGGLLNFGQNASAILGEAGGGLASLLTGGYAPQVNIREELGLEGENKFNAGDIISSKNPSPLANALGEYAPVAAAGGASIPGQMAAFGLYGAANAPTGERIKTGLKDALLTALVPGVIKYGPKAVKYLHPEKEAKGFLQELHGGTSQENMETLGKRIEFANRSGKEEALIPKNELMNSEGTSRIIPKVQVEQPNIDKISKIFSDDVSPDQAKKIENAVKKYYEDGDIVSLSEKGEEIFGHEGLSQNEIDRLESLLPFEKKRIPTGSYLKNHNSMKAYSANGELQDLHLAFSKNPTLENADALKSAISREKRFYQRQEENGTIRDQGRKKLEQLEKNEKSILKDIDNFSKTLSPKQKELYNQFRKKWAMNAKKYADKRNPNIRYVAEGNIGEVSENSLMNEFKGPLGQRVQDVLKDIGPSGEGNILYSELADLKPGDIEALGERLAQLKQTGGMQRYIKPEYEDLQKELMKRLKLRRYLTAGGLLGAGGLAAAGGHPYVGGTLALGSVPVAAGKKGLVNVLSKLLR